MRTSPSSAARVTGRPPSGGARPGRGSAGRAARHAGALRPGLDVELEAARAHALVDGLSAHAVLRPESTGPADLRAVLRRHVSELTGVPAGDLPAAPDLDDLRAGE
ncbi:TetR family transcriptional regulator C-terminal domain-containing protein [Spirillospora sp. CA-108201]